MATARVVAAVRRSTSVIPPFEAIPTGPQQGQDRSTSRPRRGLSPARRSRTSTRRRQWRGRRRTLTTVRVLHLSWEYPPLVYGGLGRHVHALAEAQAAAGHDVVVVTPHPGTEGLRVRRGRERRARGARAARRPRGAAARALPGLDDGAQPRDHPRRARPRPHAGAPRWCTRTTGWWRTPRPTCARRSRCRSSPRCTRPRPAATRAGCPTTSARRSTRIEWWLTFESRRVIACSQHMRWEVDPALRAAGRQGRRAAQRHRPRRVDHRRPTRSPRPASAMAPTARSCCSPAGSSGRRACTRSSRRCRGCAAGSPVCVSSSWARARSGGARGAGAPPARLAVGALRRAGSTEGGAALGRRPPPTSRSCPASTSRSAWWRSRRPRSARRSSWPTPAGSPRSSSTARPAWCSPRSTPRRWPTPSPRCCATRCSPAASYAPSREVVERDYSWPTSPPRTVAVYERAVRRGARAAGRARRAPAPPALRRSSARQQPAPRRHLSTTERR